ncbi:MAG TPA: hypothetical protein VKU01_23350 [Bryobacteraceae bacterium]|nr:hypothetical protein [Bryobacteraceae bacterium]
MSVAPFMTTAEVWQAFDAGDHRVAMEHLYRVIERVPGINHDLLNDVFLTVWYRMGEIRRRESLFAFSWSVVRRSRRRSSGPRLVHLDTEKVSDPSPDPERAYARHEQWAQMMRHLGRDPDRELVARALSGEHWKTTCAALGMSFTAYKNRKHRAFRRLRQFAS